MYILYNIWNRVELLTLNIHFTSAYLLLKEDLGITLNNDGKQLYTRNTTYHTW